MCAASVHNECLAIAYLDGSIRIWSLFDGSHGHNLKEQYTNDEDIITGVCTHIELTEKLCIATFQNGTILYFSH